MKSITVRVSVLVLATTFAAFHAQAANSSASLKTTAKRHITQAQLEALGFRNLQEYIDEVEVKSAVASLGNADDPSSIDYDVVWPPTQLPAPTPVPGQTGQPTNPNVPGHAPSGAGAGGTWPPTGTTVGSQVGTPGASPSPTPGSGGAVVYPGGTIGGIGSIGGTSATGLNGAIAKLTGIDINGWIALGNTVLNLIISNQPVVNVNLQPLSILPSSEPDWSMMSGWSAPVVQPCVIALVNSKNQPTYSIPFTISYNANGNLNGVGHFIANLHAEPGQFQVNAFYKVDLSTTAQKVVNMGTVANPIPGVELDAQLIVHTMLTDKRIVKKYFITGDGRVTLMTAAAGPAL